MPPPRANRKQDGMMLIEALVAILIFSVGILGLIALQAHAINLSSDAQHRTDAALLANQLIGRLSVANPAEATQFAHRPDGANMCAPSGSNSDHDAVQEWLTEVAATLPGAPADKQQVQIDTTNNVLVLTICWEPHIGSQHRHTVTTQMQWQ